MPPGYHKDGTKNIPPNGFGEKASAWKGDRAGKDAIHRWLNNHYGKPRYCEFCKRTDRNYYDWANMNKHVYRRRREDFKRLCRSCHQIHDGVIERCIKMGKSTGVKVNQYSLDGEFIKTWDSIRLAAKTLDIDKSTISLCCSGKYKRAGKFRWKKFANNT